MPIRIALYVSIQKWVICHYWVVPWWCTFLCANDKHVCSSVLWQRQEEVIQRVREELQWREVKESWVIISGVGSYTLMYNYTYTRVHSKMHTMHCTRNKDSMDVLNMYIIILTDYNYNSLTFLSCMFQVTMNTCNCLSGKQLSNWLSASNSKQTFSDGFLPPLRRSEVSRGVIVVERVEPNESLVENNLFSTRRVELKSSVSSILFWVVAVFPCWLRSVIVKSGMLNRVRPFSGGGENPSNKLLLLSCDWGWTWFRFNFPLIPAFCVLTGWWRGELLVELVCMSCDWRENSVVAWLRWLLT